MATTATTRTGKAATTIGLAAAVAASILAAIVALRAAHSGEREGHDQPTASVARSVVDVGMTVDDLDRSVRFFTEVLGFEKLSEKELSGDEWERRTGVFGLRMRVARLRLGHETIELTDYLTPRGKPFPYDTRANDHWFQHVAIVVSDIDAAYARLRAEGVEHASTGPQCLPESLPAAAGICAFYFRDPDGHFLELIEFPPGKGDERWQRGAGSAARLFLGIDHTAIVVADTEVSLAFYRDGLGLRVVGASENHGSEQEHLNNVAGARLRITTLAAASGPGVELLQYLAPTDGRVAGETVRPNDLAFWKTRLLVTRPPDALATRQRKADASSGGIEGDGESSGGSSIVRDPDGHALELVFSP